jgi:hypothetical protein
VGLAGWRIWLDEGLEFRHFLPTRRLSWSYFRALEAQTKRDAGSRRSPFFGSRRTFQYLRGAHATHVGVRIFDLAQNAVRRPLTILRRSSPALEGDAGLIRFEYQTGRLIELWRCRKDYKSNLRMVEQARWRNL